MKMNRRAAKGYECLSEKGVVGKECKTFQIFLICLLICFFYIKYLLLFNNIIINSKRICLYINRLKKDSGSQKEEMSETEQGKKS